MARTLIYPEREGRQLEFKERVDQAQALYRSIVAFANDIGGKIVVGVRDADRAVVGLSEAEVDDYLERLPQGIYDAISPYCRPLVRVVNFAGEKQILEIEVFPGTRKPYFIKGLGIPRGVYIRVGTHSKRASKELLEDLQRTSSGGYFDEQLVRDAKQEQFDVTVLGQVYGPSKGDIENFLADKVLALDPSSDALIPTVTGVVYFAKNPAHFLPQGEVLLTIFKGTTLDDPTRTVDLHGPLPSLADQTLALVMPLLSVEQKRHGSRLRATRHEVPETAMREAILNALIHRKYHIPDAIKIAVFSDRIEIFSPGNFPGPITDYLSGISYARNPHLRQLARRQGLVEKRGIGLQLMFRTCSENRNPAPIIEERGDAVKVIFSRKTVRDDRADEGLPDELKPLRAWQRERRAFQTAEACLILDMSANTVRKHLRKLVTAGLLKPIGRGRAARYEWVA